MPPILATCLAVGTWGALVPCMGLCRVTRSISLYSPHFCTCHRTSDGLMRAEDLRAGALGLLATWLG